MLYKYKGPFVIEKIKEDLHSSNDNFWPNNFDHVLPESNALQRTGLGLLYEQGQRRKTAWLSSKDDIITIILQQQQAYLFCLWKLDLSGISIFGYTPCPASLLNFTEINETLQGSTKLFLCVEVGLLVFFVMWELFNKIVPTIRGNENYVNYKFTSELIK